MIGTSRFIHLFAKAKNNKGPLITGVLIGLEVAEEFNVIPTLPIKPICEKVIEVLASVDSTVESKINSNISETEIFLLKNNEEPRIIKIEEPRIIEIEDKEARISQNNVTNQLSIAEIPSKKSITLPKTTLDHKWDKQWALWDRKIEKPKIISEGVLVPVNSEDFKTVQPNLTKMTLTEMDLLAANNLEDIPLAIIVSKFIAIPEHMTENSVKSNIISSTIQIRGLLDIKGSIVKINSLLYIEKVLKFQDLDSINYITKCINNMEAYIQDTSTNDNLSVKHKTLLGQYIHKIKVNYLTPELPQLLPQKSKITNLEFYEKQNSIVENNQEMLQQEMLQQEMLQQEMLQQEMLQQQELRQQDNQQQTLVNKSFTINDYQEIKQLNVNFKSSQDIAIDNFQNMISQDDAFLQQRRLDQALSDYKKSPKYSLEMLTESLTKLKQQQNILENMTETSITELKSTYAKNIQNLKIFYNNYISKITNLYEQVQVALTNLNTSMFNFQYGLGLFGISLALIYLVYNKTQVIHFCKQLLNLSKVIFKKTLNNDFIKDISKADVIRESTKDIVTDSINIIKEANTSGKSDLALRILANIKRGKIYRHMK